MDQLTKARRFISNEQWKAAISECRSSGMTVSKWCHVNGICEQTYYKHLKKIREEQLGISDDRVEDIEKSISHNDVSKYDYWAQKIEECQSSGLKIYEWCRENNISKDAYYYWKNKIAKSNLPVPVNRQLPEERATFKKLEVITPVPNTQAAVIIRLPNATIEINEGTSQQTIQAVLLALQNV